MPIRRKTASEAMLSGAAKKNPARYAGRGEQPQGKPLSGRAPKHLSPEERAVWREIAATCPPGLLQEADQFAVELAARALHRARVQIVRPSEINALLSLLGKLGLTPADRQRLTTAPPAPVERNEWDEF